MKLILDGDDTIWFEEQRFKDLKTLLLSLACDASVDPALVERDLEEGIRKLGFGRTVFVKALRDSAKQHGLLDILSRQAGDQIDELLSFNMQMINGFDHFLEQARITGARLYLYTKGRQEEQLRKVRSLSLEPIFTRIFVVPSKGPEVLEGVLKSIDALGVGGAPADRVTMIGNCPRDDIEPAAMLGIEAIYFNPPGNPRSKHRLPAIGYKEARDWNTVQELIFG